MGFQNTEELIAGLFATALEGQRIEITSTDANTIKFYSGDPAEAAPGEIRVESLGPGFDALSLAILAPRSVNNPDVPRAQVAVRTDKATGAARIIVDAASTTVSGNVAVSGDLSVLGVGQRRTVVAALDQPRSGTGLISSAYLTMPVEAGATYKGDALIWYTATFGNDLSYAWDVPAGTTGKRGVIGPDTSSAIGNIIAVNDRVSGAFNTRFDCGGSNGIFRQAREELVFTAGASGAVTLQFAERAAGGTATVLAHSRLTLERI